MPTAFQSSRSHSQNRLRARGRIVRKDHGRSCADSLGKCRLKRNSKHRSCARLGIISKDPIGFNAGDANLYRYAGNQPTNRTDPSRLDWLDDPAGDTVDDWQDLKRHR
jgi:hypothetical protein